MNVTSILSVAALTLLAIPTALAQEVKVKPDPKGPATEKSANIADRAIILKQRPCYPLTTCVACAKELPAVPVEHVKSDRLFRLDAETCAKTVDADLAGMTKKLDHAVIAEQKPTYPMKTSPVSGKPIEATAFDHVYGLRLVRLASKDEVALFTKDPATAMAKLDKAYIDAQLASYPIKTCPVSHEELGQDGEAVNYLYGTNLVRFCCPKCITAFEKEPEKYSQAIEAAVKRRSQK